MRIPRTGVDVGSAASACSPARVGEGAWSSERERNLDTLRS